MAIINVIGEKLCQWDTGMKVSIALPVDTTVKRVDFKSQALAELMSMKVFLEDERFVSEIPNEMLQYSEEITVYVVISHSGDEERTIFRRTFEVEPKEKPPGYVCDQQEVLRFESLEARIEALEKNGVGGSSETWTTLQDITLDEDVTKISIFNDMDGNPFKTKKMRVTFCGVMTDTILNLFFDSSTEKIMRNTYFYQAFNKQVHSNTVIEIGERMAGGMCVSKCYKNGEKLDTAYVLNGSSYYAVSGREKEYLDRISMGMNADTYFTAGTRITVEGVLE